MRARCAIFLLLLAWLAACSQDCLKLRIEDGNTLRAVLPTDSGMHALWDPEAFRSVCSFETWEQALLKKDGIRRHIQAGAFVPIYVHSDGSPLIEVRVGTATGPAAYDQASAKILRRSGAYLFKSEGALAVSGIEYIGGEPKESARALKLPPGRWSVVILEVEAIAGTPKDIAKTIPDFVALVNPEPVSTPTYRQTEETFQ